MRGFFKRFGFLKLENGEKTMVIIKLRGMISHMNGPRVCGQYGLNRCGLCWRSRRCDSRYIWSRDGVSCQNYVPKSLRKRLAEICVKNRKSRR